HEPRHGRPTPAHPCSPLRLLRPPSPTPFPYTTLFRSIPTFIRAVRNIGVLDQIASPGAFDRIVVVGSGPLAGAARIVADARRIPDRKSTRLNSSHQIISYAVFSL